MAGSAARRRREFRRYWALLTRWGWFALLCGVIAAGSAYAVSKRQAPHYRAIALLVVDQGAAGDPYTNLLASEEYVQTYLTLIKTAPVLQLAARQVGGISAEELAPHVQVGTPGSISTPIIQIQVDDQDPRRAARLADAIATSFISTQRQTAATTANDQLQRINRELASVTSQIATLTSRIKAIQAAAPGDPRLAQLRSQLAAATQLRISLQTVSSNAVGQNLLDTGNTRVFAQAVPPVAPYSPNPRRTAEVAGLAGLLLGVGLVLLLRLLDDRIRTAADVEEVTGLITIGTLGSQRGHPVLLGTRDNWSLAKSFSILRTNLSFAGLDKPLSTIVVTSAMPDEGKTTVAINLAMSLALAGKRVLLVDADLRHPAVHKYLDLPSGSGLTLHLLEEEQGPGEAPPYMPLPAMPNLLVLTAGPLPPDPTEMLNSVRMGRFLHSVLPAEGHPGLVDTVVLDTPPAVSFADAAMLAAHASGTLLVVDANRSRQNQLARAREALNRANARIVGVILNHASEKGPERGYYTYDLADAGEGATAVPPDETAALR